jgi:hypothetical protein
MMTLDAAHRYAAALERICFGGLRLPHQGLDREHVREAEEQATREGRRVATAHVPG